jgi:hypothetical protein
MQQAIQEKINLVDRQPISIKDGVRALASNAKKHEHPPKTFYSHIDIHGINLG